MQSLLCCRVYDYRKKSYPTFTQWSKGIGKVVICKALHKGNVTTLTGIAYERYGI